jgi:regulatory protein
VRLLARREHGAHELVNKLAAKGYLEPDIQSALFECQRHGFQSDSRFVENLCRTRIRQGYGPIRIRHELQNLHVDGELISAALQQEQDNWLAYAVEVWKKKYKDPVDLSYTALQKQKQFLLYRGFSTDTITMIFKD